YRENRLSYLYQFLAFGVIVPVVTSIITSLIVNSYFMAGKPDSVIIVSLVFILGLLFSLFLFTALIVGFIISITSSIRRLHDLGKPGIILLWVYLAGFFLTFIAIGPLIVLGFNLYLLFADTKREPHQFSHQTNPFLV
ncbi:hypothetical protein CJP74_07270, partial [Psittacicella melopsittaci]